MKSEHPFEGPVPDGGGDAPYEWIDEWLCEYVDGTMDPSLEAVFEQYVEANPELKAHVERLQQTRDLLCECGRSADPTADVEPAACPETACDEPASSAPASETERTRPVVALGVVSSIAVAFALGLLVGATMVTPTAPLSSSSPTAIEQTTSPSEAPPRRARAAPQVERPLLRRTAPFATSDSTERPSPLTTIGLP
jgi:anti-sigma factor RsiW